jgi:hypothetical protein
VVGVVVCSCEGGAETSEGCEETEAPEPVSVRRGTFAFSWGPYGGFYVTQSRVCLGWVAWTLIRGLEIDDLMKGFLAARESTP